MLYFHHLITPVPYVAMGMADSLSSPANKVEVGPGQRMTMGLGKASYLLIRMQVLRIVLVVDSVNIICL